MKKYLLCLSACLAILVSMPGCGKPVPQEQNKPQEQEKPEDPTPEPEPEPEPDPTPTDPREIPADDGILRVLAIGNSFSADAVEQELAPLFAAAGRKIIIGDLYIKDHEA